MQIPPEVAGLLQGIPTVGSTELVLQLLTVDADGSPHVCLLSRAQLVADDSAVRVVVYAGGTAANLDRDGRATLVVVTDGAAYYLHLAVDRREATDSLVGYTLAHRRYKRDAVPGSELRPMTYHVTPEMPGSEDWPTTRQLLARLA
ncbi:MAG TPA: pyridoxamine 5'-phosphate oxidase family protein [Mycobacteriales bacterium]|nr:pyridoxamine 5'-phosphate oxidase family protein [Mycobacteriales bacterium]